MTAKLFSCDIPYQADSSILFEPWARRPWSMLLDSARPYSDRGRYDILVTDPVTTLSTRGQNTQISASGVTSCSQANPFQLIREQLAAFAHAPQMVPFCSGALGYFGYDLGRRLEHLPSEAENDSLLPDMAVGIYDAAVVVDHRLQRATLMGWPEGRERQQHLQKLSEELCAPKSITPPTGFALKKPISESLDREAYGEAFRKIQAYLRAGDCYQVNLTRRFKADVEGDPWAAYRQLREVARAPFSSYLNLPSGQVLSSSPERFLSISHGHLLTQPIKGTRPRHDDPDQDAAYAAALSESAKDRAENIMIVDLLRNDLGRVCQTASVDVPELWALESFSNVHHLVSTVTGQLRRDKDAIDALMAAFPGGSITGAPKLRAMQIIEELEPVRRNVYCGAIGYIDANGRMDSNIAIRTLTHSDGDLRFWTGGGIVLDSDVDEEFSETLDKAAAMQVILG